MTAEDAQERNNDAEIKAGWEDDGGTASTACPRCANNTWTMELDARMSVRVVVGKTTADYANDGTDSFLELTCNNCDLTLANEPGETRLRKAYAYDSADDANAAGNGESVATLEDGSEAKLQAIATILCEQIGR